MTIIEVTGYYDAEVIDVCPSAGYYEYMVMIHPRTSKFQDRTECVGFISAISLGKLINW